MSRYINEDEVIEEVARRDTTDGTIKVFSGYEIGDVLAHINTASCPFCGAKLEAVNETGEKQ